MRIFIETAKKEFERADGCTCSVEAAPGAAVVRLEVFEECPAHRNDCATCPYDTPIGGDCGLRYCPRYPERSDNAQP